MIEAMKRAYADRARFLGDPDFVDRCRSRGLTSKRYAAALRARIDPRARDAVARDRRPAIRPRSRATTPRIISVVDRFGNAVANTYTLNLSYGVGLVAEGTGVLLNNELDDFAAKPGAPNAFGLVGGDANAPGPGKRPLSSMTPTIVLQGRQAVPGHRLAGRQPHHHHGAAGDPQRDRPRHEHRRGGARRRACIINGCRTRSWSRRPCRAATVAGAGGARPHASGSGRRSPRPTRSWSRRTASIGAADTRTRGALAAGY